MTHDPQRTKQDGLERWLTAALTVAAAWPTPKQAWLALKRSLAAEKGRAVQPFSYPIDWREELTAIVFLKTMRDMPGACVPSSREGAGLGEPSNSELRRWLEKGSVLINGCRPGPTDLVRWPISELVYFPGSVSQTTICACWLTHCPLKKRGAP